MDIMSFNFCLLHSLQGIHVLALFMANVMIITGIVSALVGDALNMKDADDAFFAKVLLSTDDVEEAFEAVVEDVDPEVLFFGELLPEGSALPLPVMDERVRGAVESWSCDHDGLTAAIYRVAGVNRAGRIINPSNGRFIPFRELSLWLLPADLAKLAV